MPPLLETFEPLHLTAFLDLLCFVFLLRPNSLPIMSLIIPIDIDKCMDIDMDMATVGAIVGPYVNTGKGGGVYIGYGVYIG